ncbi:MAG: serpin family protein [bacterium]
MIRSARTLAVSTAAALSLACGSSGTEPGGGGSQTTPLDALPRQLTASELQLVSSANTFSFSLFRQLSSAQKDSNVFTSPLSASMALGMTANGAAGSTLDQMRATLAFGGTTEADVNASYKSLIALLRGLDNTVDFRIANSIWYRNGFPFNQSFIDVSKTAFDATVTPLDFSNPSSVKTINDWVSTSTAGKIPTIVDQIEDDKVMFLINAIYFKGSWRDRFDPSQTTDAQFHSISGDQPMKLMHRHGKFSYLFTPDFAAADLPYGNSAFTMTVVLPHPGKSIDAVAASIKASDWSTWMGQFHEITSDIELPRFKLEWQRVLNDDLKALGMHDAFVANGADFTRMSTTRGHDLFISIVKQKTYVDVNEEGTEAAAVTNVGVSVTSAPPSLRVDRPFLFVIRERLSGTVIFMGKIVKLP